MGATRAHGSGVTLVALGVVLLAGVLLGALLTAGPAAARAELETGTPGAGVVFESPQAEGAFGEGVTFSTTFRSPQPPLRVELLSRVPGREGDVVELAAVERIGDDTWRATVRRGGHIVPNTHWEYRFRVITAEGDAVGPSAGHRVVDERLRWQVLEGDGVNVWWHAGGDDFGRRALAIVEDALASASELLGIGDIEPIDFFVYADTRQFRQAMGPATRENVGGQAHPAIRTLFGLIEPRQIDSDWVEELLTHELAHLVFDEAVANPYDYPPRWLNEGVAVYLSRGYTDGDRAQVQGAAGSGTIIPLEGLGGNFPTRVIRSSLAYAESVSAVAFFVETYGEDRLVELITSFGEGKGLDEAFVAATGRDFAAFDEAWLASLGTERPEPYGPRDSEPRPVPEAWQAEADGLLG